MREFPGLATRHRLGAAGSRPILTRAVRQQTCYALTGLPYLLSGICTGASSRHGMAGQQARLPRPERCPSARAVVSTRPPGSPAPGSTPQGARAPRARGQRLGALVRHPGHDHPTRPPLVAVRALRRITSPGRPARVHDTMETPVRSGCQRAVRPAWIDRAGPARRAAQVSAQDVDTGLPPRGGRRARLGIISWCAQIVPVSPRCPTAKCPARWHQSPLQMLVKQRSRNPRSRRRHGPNRWNRRQCRHRSPRQCRRHRRRRYPGRSRGHCRRRNRNRSRSQYRTPSRTRSRCRRRRRQRPTRSAATSSPSGAGPRLSQRYTVAARSCCHHDGALILPVGD